MTYNKPWKKVKVKALVAQVCPTLCSPMHCSPPGSSVHGILQARILEWVVTSRGSSWPGIEPTSPALAGRFFTVEPPGKLLIGCDAMKDLNTKQWISLLKTRSGRTGRPERPGQRVGPGGSPQSRRTTEAPSSRPARRRRRPSVQCQRGHRASVLRVLTGPLGAASGLVNNTERAGRQAENSSRETRCL